MLNKLSDHYRIVNPDPTDALITQRKEAIVAFMEKFSSSDVRYACADIAAFGLSPALTAAQVTVAKLITEAIKVPQPAFSSDILANAVDLRVFSGIALGEYLADHADWTTSALIISALATRPLPSERYLSNFVSDLLETARGVFDERGRAERSRPRIEIPAIQGADLASVAKNLTSALNSFKEAIDGNLRSDREELEVLWWIFSRYSKTLEKPFQALDISQRIFACGSELAELVILPPTPGSSQFLHATLKEERALTLRQLVEASTSAVKALTGRRAEAGAVIAAHAALLPLTWLSCRRVDSGMATGWENEFEQKTHISAGDERTAPNWATQVFNECVAARLLASSGQNQP